jgi:hypothetical protein
MGVPNYMRYKISEHAFDRMQKRFGILRDEAQRWIERFLQNATFYASQEAGKQKFKWNEITAILNVNDYVVITIYPKSIEADKTVTRQINPEIKTVINRSLGEFVKAKRNQRLVKINGPMIELYDSWRLLEKDSSQVDFRQKLNIVNELINRNDLVVEEAEQIIGKEVN